MTVYTIHEYHLDRRTSNFIKIPGLLVSNTDETAIAEARLSVHLGAFYRVVRTTDDNDTIIFDSTVIPASLD
jgi:hypothetical protein